MAAPPLRVIVDTDAGSDDVMAIAFLLARADVKIEAITVDNGLAHVGPGARNMARLAAVAGQPIPVYAGRETPLAGNNQFPREWRDDSDRMPGVDLPEPLRAPSKEEASVFLARYLGRQPRHSISILALGPLTNLAQAFEHNPAARSAIREIVIMGGAVRVPGNLADGGALTNGNKSAEWNIYVDPLAAARVLASGVPLRWVPLDATNQVPVNLAFVDEFTAEARTPLAKVVAQVLASDRKHIEGGYFYAWDPLAAVGLVEPSVLKLESLRLELRQSGTEQGRTAEVAGTPNSQVAVGADGPRFKKIFFQVLLHTR